MARKNPKNETTQKRKRFPPDSDIEKLQVVLIKYEIIVAIAKATPLAIDGTGNMYSINTVAMTTCNTVTSKPEKVKRTARCLMKTGYNASRLISSHKNAQ